MPTHYALRHGDDGQSTAPGLRHDSNCSLFSLPDHAPQGMGTPPTSWGVTTRAKRAFNGTALFNWQLWASSTGAEDGSEWTLLRDHIDSILTSDAAAKLVVYGDFNDTRASPAIKLIQGTYNHPNYLTPLPLKDRNGEYWTHFWDREDVYSRFDWIMVSQPLKPEVNFEASRIIDDSEWDKASDHRAVMLLLK